MPPKGMAVFSAGIINANLDQHYYLLAACMSRNANRLSTIIVSYGCETVLAALSAGLIVIAN